MCCARLKQWLIVFPAMLGLSGFCADAKPFITWNNPPKAPQPLLEHKTYTSTAMKTEVGYNIYLPPGYAESGARYPVVYWFHGRNNTESSDQFPARYLDEGIKDKSLPPMIIVYASGGSQSCYSDSTDGKWLAETTIIKELIPHIDATYRTIATREGRAVQGMSMGGAGCLKLAFKHSELFSSAVAFAGGYVDAAFLNTKSPELLEKMFGGDAKNFEANHPFTWAKKNADQFRGKLAIKMYIGNKDYLYDCNKQMHAILEELKIPHEYIEVDGVEHNLTKLSQFARKDGFKFAADHFGATK